MSEVGYVRDVPELKGKTLEEQIAFLRREIEDGPQPLLPSRPASSASASPTSPEGIFDLVIDLDDEEDYQAELYTMPGKRGAQVWVHPCSPADAIYVNRQVVKELRNAGLMREQLTPDQAKVQAQDRAIEMQFRTYVWQTIRCARKGPEPGAEPVFKPTDAESLLNKPRMVDAVREISELSNCLSEGKTEATLMHEALVHFFGCVGPWLETLRSQWTADAGTSCPASLEDFAHSVSTLRQHNRWRPSELAMLALRLQMVE